MARKAPSQFTAPRIRALEYLEKNPGHHVVGCGSARWHIRRLGWSEWALNDRNQIIGEQITDLGRSMLTARRLSQIPKPQATLCPHDCFLGCKLPANCGAVASTQRSGKQENLNA